MTKTKSVNDMFLEWAEQNNVNEKRSRKILEPRKVSPENWKLNQNAIRIQKGGANEKN